MLVRDDAFQEIEKIALVTLSLFRMMQDKSSLQENLFSHC